MYDTQTRLKRLHYAIGARRKRRRSIGRSLWGTLCVVLAGAELSLLIRFNRVAIFEGEAPYLHGASMLSSDTGGYVLVAVVSFVVAVVITVTCVKYRERKHGKDMAKR